MTRIIIFAKAPVPGFAKTRLIPSLGDKRAAELANKMLLCTLHQAIEAAVGTVELCVTPAIHHPAWSGIQLPAGIEISDQGEGDLGARLGFAAKRGLDRGEAVLLIGTDCIEISAQLLRSTAIALDHNEAVIHPATDGGYVLLGLSSFDPLLFEDIAWSTDVVAAVTMDRIKRLGWSLEVGAALHDIDEPLDLRYIPVDWLQA